MKEGASERVSERLPASERDMSETSRSLFLQLPVFEIRYQTIGIHFTCRYGTVCKYIPESSMHSTYTMREMSRVLRLQVRLERRHHEVSVTNVEHHLPPNATTVRCCCRRGGHASWRSCTNSVSLECVGALFATQPASRLSHRSLALSTSSRSERKIQTLSPRFESRDLNVTILFKGPFSDT